MRSERGQDDLGATAGLRYRNGRPRTSVTELAAENRILKAQIKSRLLLSDGEKVTLAEIAHRLGRMALGEVAATAKPNTILGCYRKLIANKFNGSRIRKRVDRPGVAEEIERLVVRMANENPSWGYDRIVGALANLGHRLSDQTVGNILRRHGFSTAPQRKQTVSWKKFIRSHRVSFGKSPADFRINKIRRRFVTLSHG
jgi:hypothetical protein